VARAEGGNGLTERGKDREIGGERAKGQGEVDKLHHEHGQPLEDLAAVDLPAPRRPSASSAGRPRAGGGPTFLCSFRGVRRKPVPHPLEAQARVLSSHPLRFLGLGRTS
jgi:hypothetical protein